MAARLGNVIYWLSWFIAAPCIALAALLFFGAYMESSEFVPIAPIDTMLARAFFALGGGVGSWVIGRVSLYILAGR